MSDKLVHVQTIMMESEMLNLKMKTKEATTKEAVRKAILHYLECNENVTNSHRLE